MQTLSLLACAKAYNLVIRGIEAYITKVANIFTTFRAYALANTAAIDTYSSANKFIANYKILKNAANLKNKSAA